MKKIPFLPMRFDRAKARAQRFRGWGESMHKFFPGMEFDLEQAGMPFDAREWLGLGFFAGGVYFLLLFAAAFSITLGLGLPPQAAGGLAFAVGMGVGGMVFMYFSLTPRLHTKKKVREIEKNLPYAMNHILIQIRSGVTLFAALVSIGWSNYGQLSLEFRKAVNEINTGKSEISALEQLARDNPSLFFRRIMWQMVNALKAGSDIGVVLKAIVENITSEQLVAIKKYGSQLNPMALFYMMLVVIFPTLGIVFLLILFSFIGGATFGLEPVLGAILGFLVFVQVMFIGMVKNKRPGGL
ncbi:MAG: type II secretion system F family protein [Candidatus Aenigmarchaeota archaeon]|nr:type II secretion system F family protein [Candidatus Aenigmarchaeota archaeon]